MRIRIIFLLSLAALLIHILLGWAWSPVAAFAGGYRVKSGGWWIGATGLGISWTGLVLFNLLAAPSQVMDMARVVGSLAGNLPDWSIFFISILIGTLLGAIGGLLGQTARQITLNYGNNNG